MEYVQLLPIIVFMLNKGISLMLPNGTVIRTVEDLAVINEELKALVVEVGGSFANIAIPEETPTAGTIGSLLEGGK
jgi:hypothetical protein